MRTAFVFIVLALFGAAVLTGCGGDGNGQTDSLAIESTPVKIVRLDSLIEKYAEMDSASRVSVLADNKKQLDYFRQIVSPEIDSVDNSLMMMWPIMWNSARAEDSRRLTATSTPSAR